MVNFDRQMGIEIANAINKRIKMVSQDLYNNAPYTIIKFGRVVSINGKRYSIKINNALYTNIYALKGSNLISVGDSVICVVPNNQYSNMFILGALDM